MQLSALVGAFLVASMGLAVGGLATSLGEAEAYETINSYLEYNVRATSTRLIDIEENMRRARSWLKSLARAPSRSGSLLAALRQFTSLETMTCSRAAMETLEANRRAMRRRASAPRRIERMLQHYRSKHANQCQAVFSEALGTGLRRLPQDLLGPIQTLTLGAVESNLRRFEPTAPTSQPLEWASPSSEFRQFVELMSPREIATIMFLPRRLEGPLARDFSLGALEFLTRSDPSHRFLKPPPARAEVGALYERYLRGPCERFVGRLDPELVELAAYDEQLIKSITTREAFMPVFDLHFTKASRSLCVKLLEDKRPLEAIIESIGSSS